MTQSKIILLAFFMTVSTLLSAKHILSGSMTYNCLGNNEYEINMIIYRDCFGGGASFDDPASISIYANETDLVATYEVPVTILEAFDPIECDNTPIQYCSEKASYTFTTVLPQTPGISYQVIYQRCCWSESVSNIMEPGERGITVMTNISEFALQECNSQPEIDMPLSFSACPGELVEIPFEVNDVDGDSLVYELCMPFEGGGLGGTPNFPGDPTACDGVTPNPACPPPYNTLPFATGFDINNPFPTTNGINVDPVNGTLSFTPSVVGIYVYAICITEYRNGEMLSVSTGNIETTSGLQPVSQNEIEINSWEMTQSFANDELFFTSNLPSTNGVISLFDISGKLIVQENIGNSTAAIIPTNNLNAGIYFVSLNTDNYSKTFKVIVH